MYTQTHQYEQPTQPTPPKDDMSDLFLKRHAMSITCRFDGTTGKLVHKEENTEQHAENTTYAFDSKGRLLRALHNGRPVESYRYNGKGQRISTTQGSLAAPVRYAYDTSGKLVRAGNDVFTYDERGNLASRQNGNRITRYVYEDTRLVRVFPHCGEPIRYVYDSASPNPVGPVQKYRGAVLVMEYVWKSLTHLASCMDYERGLEYRFTYDSRQTLDRIHLAGTMRHPAYEKPPVALADKLWPNMEATYPSAKELPCQTGLQLLFGPQETERVLLCGCDQVGTPKLFTQYNGKLVKKIRFDSFGNILHDSMPQLPVPVGFAGGLYDPDTGLVRFGYRDYDTGTGRFTCPDPLGDTGGDHDLYEYCVDDPVTMNDPAGLFPPLLAFLAGKALAAGIAAVGLSGAARFTDWLKSRRDGKESTPAMDAMKEIAPTAGAVIGTGMLSGTTMASGMIGAAGRYAGAALHASKYGDKIVKALPHVKDFIEGAAIEGPPAMTLGGSADTIIKKTIDKMQKEE